MTIGPNSEAGIAQAARPATGNSQEPLVVLIGNPNVGKTALFNRLTGQNARIGNYPGITVERRSGSVKHEAVTFEVVDVPGTYSLSARSAEEQIAILAVLGLGEHPRPSLCVAVVDASQLGRNLYLVLQLAELGVPFVLAVNMIDEVKENPPNLAALEALLGVPCVATSARSGEGVAQLKARIAQAVGSPPKPRAGMSYPPALVLDLDRVAGALPSELSGGSVERQRALASWALSSVEEDDELEGIPHTLRERCLEVRRGASERDIDAELIGTRWAFIDRKLPELYSKLDAHPPKRKLSARVDRVLLHPLFGFVAFVAVMLLVFQALFSWSDPAISAIEQSFSWLSRLLEAHLAPGALRDLLTVGVLSGVGNVVVFLPQILLLFFFIGILEDSGYMARVAYLMDRVMKSLGLHGRAFVPMLSGFACAVPAILATRTMERQRDRLLTMLVIPLMTCSARLPVYSLIVAALFPGEMKLGFVSVQSALMVGMYLFSLLTTLAAAGILGRTVVRARRVPLLLELPPYRLPSLRGTLKLVWERATVFLREAGTVILACTVALWVLLSYPKPSEPVAPAPSATSAQQAPAEHTRIEASFGGKLGKAIEPVIAPLGFDWRLGIGIVGAFAAREVFVSTLGLVYGLDDLDDEAAPLREKMKSERRENGAPVYTPLVGLSLMIFFALSCQCMSTLAVVRRETKTWRWPAFMFAYMTGLAYIASLIVYQGGRWIGF